MRTLKFRVWAKSEWDGHFSSKVFTMPEMMNGDPFDYFSDDPMNRWHMQEDIEQFTGLHDITGRELYEGDRVAYETVETVRRHNGTTLEGVIIWQEKAGRFGIREFRDGAYYSDKVRPLAQINLTYIGNIHEGEA